MRFNCPLSDEKADHLIRILELSEGDRVIDVGCGKGEFLLQLVEHFKAQGLGIDCHSGVIAIARESAETRISRGSCDFRQSDICDLSLADNSFAAAICIGSTHAYGVGKMAFPNALKELKKMVKPGGKILIGEGYWKQTPDPEYLKRIGDPVGIYHTHHEIIQFAESQGLSTLYALVSNEDEWDQFEWSHQMNIVKESQLRPMDPEVSEKLLRRKQWMEGYLRWGRSTMGFGFYLFQNPI